jgi:phage-related minor tail protein
MTQELIGAGAQRDSRVPMPGPVLTRESQLKLDYYERFGQLLQEQLDTVVARAASTIRDLERERSDMAAQNIRVDQRTQALREEAAALRREVAALQEEAQAIRDESQREQDQMLERLGTLYDDARQLVEQREQAQAELARDIQNKKREQAILAVQNLRLKDEVRASESELAQRRAEAAALVDEVERVRRERVPLATEVARLREEAQGLEEECTRRREEAKAIIGQAQEEAARILAGVEAGSGAIISRALLELGEIGGPPTPRAGNHASPNGSAPATDDADIAPAIEGEGPWQPLGTPRVPSTSTPETTVSRLVIRPEGPAARDQVRRVLDSLAEVVRTEPDASSGDDSALLVTHLSARSLLGLMLTAGGLDFQILERSDDHLEIEVVTPR